MAKDTSLKSQWFYILLALASGHRHGLAISRDVQELSGGRVRLWPVTLYGSLEELADRGWIEEIAAGSKRPDESERKRYYGLTKSGRQVFDAETKRLADLVKLARAAGRNPARHQE